jgi:uncharacterized RDD family membrane protein YckC
VAEVEPRLDLTLAPAPEAAAVDPPTVAVPGPPPADLAIRLAPASPPAVESPTPATAIAVATDVGPDADREAVEVPSLLGVRVGAGLIDLGLLLAIDAAVVVATTRVLGLPVAEAARLPQPPMLVFFLLLALGYLTLCTVLAGQTLGKRAFGLAVVEPGGGPVRFGHAVVRACLQVLTVPLLGLGFLPALLGSDRRTLYDRLAGTEVVRRGR